MNLQSPLELIGIIQDPVHVQGNIKGRVMMERSIGVGAEAKREEDMSPKTNPQRNTEVMTLKKSTRIK